MVLPKDMENLKTMTVIGKKVQCESKIVNSNYFPNASLKHFNASNSTLDYF